MKVCLNIKIDNKTEVKTNDKDNEIAKRYFIFVILYMKRKFTIL